MENLCQMCSALCNSEKKKPEYPFEDLLQEFASEFIDEQALVGNLEDLEKNGIGPYFRQWIYDYVNLQDSKINNTHRLSSSPIRETIISLLREMIPASKFLNYDIPLMDHGLDSIGATHFVSLLNQQLKIKLPPTIIFEFPTIQELTWHISKITGNSTQSFNQFLVYLKQNMVLINISQLLA
jgi:acyl carrier protein